MRNSPSKLLRVCFRNSPSNFLRPKPSMKFTTTYGRNYLECVVDIHSNSTSKLLFIFFHVKSCDLRKERKSLLLRVCFRNSPQCIFPRPKPLVKFTTIYRCHSQSNFSRPVIDENYRNLPSKILLRVCL